MKIIVLAGGGGTRLYPLSTQDKPKQFLALANNEPLIINTIKRFLGVVSQENVLVVTGKKYEKITHDTLNAFGLGGVKIVYEPCAKNTAPAISLGVRFAVEKLGASDSEALIVVPSDHVIRPTDKYMEYVNIAKEYAEKSGGIVTMGITPTRPDTAYGYIRATKNNEKDSIVTKILEFREKPNFDNAQKYVQSGEYYWNAGMFCFVSKVFESEIKSCTPDLFELYSQGYNQFEKNFGKATPQSIDYALAEKSKNFFVVPMALDWSDIGGWGAYYEYCEKDESGNVIIGEAIVKNCKNCLIISKNGRLSVMGQINNIIVGNGEDVVMLPMDQSDKIKDILPC